MTEESKEARIKHKGLAGAEERSRDLIANLLQVAHINKLLPKGYRFELFEVLKRQNDPA